MTAPVLRPGDRVTLSYRLACAGQDIVDTFQSGPETFVLGSGEIDPRLELLLHGLAEGARQTWQLEPWQAFGMRDEALLQALPREDFVADRELEPGHQVEFTLPNGQILLGTILKLEADTVWLDFNHPLAGLPLEFEVHILAIDHAK